MDTVNQLYSFGSRFRVITNHPIRAFRHRTIRARASQYLIDTLRAPVSLLAATTLGIAALAGIFFLTNSHQSRIMEDVLPDQVLRSLSISRNENTRENLLERVNKAQERKISSQIHFVSEIILKNRSKSYPLTPAQALGLASMIVSESVHSGFDPLLVASIIKSESTFNPRAKSSAGALGLMQMMPSTGAYVASVAGYHSPETTSLHDPAYNIKLGILYLSYLRKLFKGNDEHMLIAYNWGPENVRQVLRAGKVAPLSTVKYAQKVLGHYRSWAENFDLQAPRYRHFDFDRASIQPFTLENVG